MEGCHSNQLSALDKDDVVLAHQYRLSLPSSPSQSSFRVLALLFFEEIGSNDDDSSVVTAISHLPPWVKQQSQDGRHFIVGTNDEPGYMGGAICAERAAMVQLRFLPNFEITKLVIVTDCPAPIAPGMLCREFLAGHPSVPLCLRVICAGCQCTRCYLKDDALFPGAREYVRARQIRTDLATISGPTTADCVDGFNEHSLQTLVATLADFYSYPSPYTRLTAFQSVALGEAYSESEYSDRDLDALHPISKRLLELAILEAKQQLAANHNGNIHPIQFGAAVMLEDETIVTSHQLSALEYGCTLDAVSQLAPYLQDETHPPILLVQADQYGIAHAPFAPARSFLSEHGYEECRVLLHHLPPHDLRNSTPDHPLFDKLRLREVRVADLAPSAPAWITGMESDDEDNVESIM